MQGYVTDLKGNEIPIGYGGEQFIHCDCMDLLKAMPDQSVDLALVDPPYGHILEQDFKRADVSRSGGRFDKYGKDVITRTGGTWSKKYQRDTSIKRWDVAPPKEYFDELFRVSKEQIIWGGNYFTEFLPPSRCFVIWHKLTISDKFSMAMAEYAWASFRENAKLISLPPQDKERFHPCMPAGEKVLVNNKWVKVEDVRVGDRARYGKVSGVTVHFANKIVSINDTVKATYNHPFLILRNNKVAWCEAEQLEIGDYILQSIYGGGLCIKQKKGISENGMEILKKVRNNTSSISRFGKVFMKKSLMVIKSITRIATRQTITLKTCNLSLPLNTSGFTVVACLKTDNGSSLAKYAKGFFRVLKNTGIFLKAGLTTPFAKNAMSRKPWKKDVFVLQKVGSVKITNEPTKVYNLSVDNIPAFDTMVGLSHNTQKPVVLYEFCLQQFAKPGQVVLDTHAGSGSSLIACHHFGCHYIGCEINERYYNLAKARIDKDKSQGTLFDFTKEML